MPGPRIVYAVRDKPARVGLVAAGLGVTDDSGGRHVPSGAAVHAQQGSTEMTAGSVPSRSVNVAASALVSETVQVIEL